MNDKNRAVFVSNDEGLYNLWKQSGKSLGSYVRSNRALIDSVLKAVASGEKQQHFLVYG